MPVCTRRARLTSGAGGAAPRTGDAAGTRRQSGAAGRAAAGAGDQLHPLEGEDGRDGPGEDGGDAGPTAGRWVGAGL